MKTCVSKVNLARIIIVLLLGIFLKVHIDAVALSFAMKIGLFSVMEHGNEVIMSVRPFSRLLALRTVWCANNIGYALVHNQYFEAQDKNTNRKKEAIRARSRFPFGT